MRSVGDPATLKPSLDNEVSTHKDAVETEVHQPHELPPASFFTLFRYTTRTELLLDMIGLIVAAIVGAAQVQSFMEGVLAPLSELLFYVLARAVLSFQSSRQ